jgi:hypothetical protein
MKFLCDLEAAGVAGCKESWEAIRCVKSIHDVGLAPGLDGFWRDGRAGQSDRGPGGIPPPFSRASGPSRGRNSTIPEKKQPCSRPPPKNMLQLRSSSEPYP